MLVLPIAFGDNHHLLTLLNNYNLSIKTNRLSNQIFHSQIYGTLNKGVILELAFLNLKVLGKIAKGQNASIIKEA